MNTNGNIFVSFQKGMLEKGLLKIWTCVVILKLLLLYVNTLEKGLKVEEFMHLF